MLACGGGAGLAGGGCAGAAPPGRGNGTGVWAGDALADINSTTRAPVNGIARSIQIL